MGTMTAKFAGRCKACGGAVSVGEQIDYGKTTGARHLACAGGGAARPSPPRAGGPSDKQVSYALRLLGEAGYDTRHMSARYKALGASMRERSGSVEGWLRAMTRSEISGLIDRLQADARESGAAAAAAAGPSDDAGPARPGRYPESAPVEGAHEIGGRRTGRGDRRYEVGQTICAAKVQVPGGGPGGHYYTILASELRPPCEDNGEYEWHEVAWVRVATDAEAAPVVERVRAARAATIVPRYVSQLVTAGESVPEASAALETVAPSARLVWEWVAPTRQTDSGAVLAADVAVRVQRVRVLDDGSVVGHHGGSYDDYRPSAWIVRQPSETLLLALAGLTGDSASLVVAADAAEDAGVVA